MSFRSHFEKLLHHAAKRLPIEPVPPTLYERVNNALPPLEPAKTARRIFLNRLALAGVAATVSTGLLLAPFVTQSKAATMREALARTRTWHFIGWRLVDGKKVRWEVWGNRSPFLYREEIGDEVLLDDGTRRIHVIPPDKTTGRKNGSILVSPSQPAQTAGSGIANTNGGGGYLLAGINGDRKVDCATRADGADYACTGQRKFYGGPEQTDEITTLFVNGKTHLPARYTVTQKEYHVPGAPEEGFRSGDRRLTREYTSAELVAQYDVRLHSTLLDLNLPKEYAYTDTTVHTNTTSSRAKEGVTCIRQGVTMKAEVVGRDEEGNLHLRVRGWLGTKPFRGDTTGLGLLVSEDYTRRGIYFEPSSRRFEMSPYVTDDAGNRYVWLNPPYNTSLDVENPDIWLAPLEPLTDRKAPHDLVLSLNGEMSRYERRGNSGQFVPVVKDTFRFRVPLPKNTTSLGWETAPNSHGMRFHGIKPTFLQEQAEKRAAYYFDLGSHSAQQRERNIRNAPLEPVYADKREGWFRRAAYWSRVAEQEARKHKDIRTAQRHRAIAADATDRAERQTAR